MFGNKRKESALKKEIRELQIRVDELDKEVLRLRQKQTFYTKDLNEIPINVALKKVMNYIEIECIREPPKGPEFYVRRKQP